MSIINHLKVDMNNFKHPRLINACLSFYSDYCNYQIMNGNCWSGEIFRYMHCLQPFKFHFFINAKDWYHMGYD